jgi:RNA-binding protein
MTRKNNKLKKLGTISHVTSTNKLIVPSNKTPRIGLLVVNKNNKAIGKINDIIGSTKNPYISIKTNHKFKKANVGEEIYLAPKDKKRRMRPRHKK